MFVFAVRSVGPPPPASQLSDVLSKQSGVDPHGLGRQALVNKGASSPGIPSGAAAAPAQQPPPPQKKLKESPLQQT